jgi:hypothetical protein
MVFVSIDVKFEKIFELTRQYTMGSVKSGAYVQLQALCHRLGGYSYQQYRL